MTIRLYPSLALACALFACASSSACSATETPRDQRLTPESELPPDYAAAWRAWYEGSEDWDAWRPKVVADPRLAGFFVDNLIRVMVRHYDHAKLSRAGELPGLFERSRHELLFLGEFSGPLLVELVFVGDSVVAFLAGDLLVSLDDSRLTLSLARKLESPEVEERRRAAEWLVRFPQAGNAEDQVWQLLQVVAQEDEEWGVRAQAVRAIGARSLMTGRLDRARPVLSRALADPDHAVVRSACAALHENRDVRAVPALVNLLERIERGEGDLLVLSAAQSCLCRLTGLEGDRSAIQWRAWWRENRP